MVARGLVLPVLVALRDIAPGEQLLRDYGADWWREGHFVDAWMYFEEEQQHLGLLLGSGLVADSCCVA